MGKKRENLQKLNTERKAAKKTDKKEGRRPKPKGKQIPPLSCDGTSCQGNWQRHSRD
jgi:hypothetical protein